MSSTSQCKRKHTRIMKKLWNLTIVYIFLVWFFHSRSNSPTHQQNYISRQTRRISTLTLTVAAAAVVPEAKTTRRHVYEKKKRNSSRTKLWQCDGKWYWYTEPLHPQRYSACACFLSITHSLPFCFFRVFSFSISFPAYNPQLYTFCVCCTFIFSCRCRHVIVATMPAYSLKRIQFFLAYSPVWK